MAAIVIYEDVEKKIWKDVLGLLERTWTEWKAGYEPVTTSVPPHDHDTRYNTKTEITTALSAKADTNHTHANLVTTTDPRLSDARTPTAHTHANYVDTNDARLSNARTPTAHQHSFADITSGWPGGTTNFLRADGTWAAPPAGGGGSYKAIWNVLSDAAALAWTNMPAAVMEIFGTTLRRGKLNLTGATQARVVANQTIAGAANAQLKLQYSTDQSAWTDAGPFVAVGAGTGLKVGAFANLAAGAKADVFVRIAGISGDGTADPAFGAIYVEVS